MSDVHDPPDAAAPVIRLGTCSWTAQGWVGSVYPSGTPPSDFLRVYATRFSTVEIDATFYAAPARRTVEGWYDRTPDAFVFAAKVPKVITHDRLLEDCAGEYRAFAEAMGALGGKLGALLFQFPYFARGSGVTSALFRDRLRAFLDTCRSEGVPWAIELRNKAWLTPQLFELLTAHGIALALTDHPWMDRPEGWLRRGGVLTGPLAYIRWLGDRKGIERITQTWGESVIDRRRDLAEWMPVLEAVLEARMPALAYVNNHYSGHAPNDVELLREMLGPRCK